MARLIGDQLQQHELQFAGTEHAAPTAATFAMLPVPAEAVAAAMAEMAFKMSSNRAAIGRQLERVGIVPYVCAAAPAKAATMVAVAAMPMTSARSGRVVWRHQVVALQ